MALNFSKQSTQFVRNLVELGVCENVDCLNAYHPPAGITGRSGGSGHRSKTLLAAATSTPSTRPVIAVDVPRWVQTLDSDDFPLTEVCHQLSSSEQQMSQPLETYIDELFSAVSRCYGVQLETIVRALRLLERVQVTNIRAHHQKLLLSQSSHGSDRNSNASSYGSIGNALLTVYKADSSAATLRAGSVGAGQRSGLLSTSKVPVPPTSRSPTTTATAASSTTGLHGTPVLGPQKSARSAPIFCPHSSSLTHASVWDGSSLSSGTVGPLTDTEQLSYGKCSGATVAATAAMSSSLTSWCLPMKSPCEVHLSGSAASNAVDLPSLLSRLQPCAACAGSRVFTLQYYNVHLLLAACLALSISINEVEVMEAMTEDTLMHQIAEVSHCMDLPLQMAVRVVCETLGGELCVFDSDVDVLVHRLNVVETCVFATEGV